jgi:hypothetical protein
MAPSEYFRPSIQEIFDGNHVFRKSFGRMGIFLDGHGGSGSTAPFR